MGKPLGVSIGDTTMKDTKTYRSDIRLIGLMTLMIAAASLFIGCEQEPITDIYALDIDGSSGTSASAQDSDPVTTDPTTTTDITTTSSGLPTNPSIPNSGSSREQWYFGYKSYDGTFRIRWPTYFATTYGVGPGSYNTVNGQRATFRSFDVDNGARRPSYTIPGPSSRFRGEVTCILYSSSGTALGWFRTNYGGSRTSGSLP